MSQEPFPVIYSTLAPQAIVEQILPLYKIDQVTSCQLWHRGLSDVYLVQTVTSEYILRISHHHWRSKSDIDFELELLDFLRQDQLPVAYPLWTKEGQLSVEINAPEGKRYSALFIKAKGEVALGDLNFEQSQKLGKTLAKLHQATANFHCSHQRLTLNLQYLLDNSMAEIAPFLYHRSQDYDYLQQTCCQIKQKLQNLPTEPPFWVICWGDPHSGNAHFTEDNQVTLFDFDQCGYGWRAFDLAKFLHVSLSSGVSKNIREALLESYQSVQKLTEFELSCLQQLTQTAHIWSWAISINSAQIHDYSRLDRSFFTRRLEQLKRLRSRDWQLF